MNMLQTIVEQISAACAELPSQVFVARWSRGMYENYQSGIVGLFSSKREVGAWLKQTGVITRNSQIRYVPPSYWDGDIWRVGKSSDPAAHTGGNFWEITTDNRILELKLPGWGKVHAEELTIHLHTRLEVESILRMRIMNN